MCPTITTKTARLTVWGPTGLKVVEEATGEVSLQEESVPVRARKWRVLGDVEDEVHRNAEDGPLGVLGGTAVWGDRGGCWPGKVRDRQGEVLEGEGTPWSLDSWGK